MKKNIIIAVLSIYAVVSTTIGLTTIADRDDWEYDGHYAIQACVQVANYCDSTADTGQMDDFIQSESGQEFWHNWQKVIEHNQ